MTDIRDSLTPFYRMDAITGWRQSPLSESILQDPVLHQLRLGKPGDFPIAPNEPFGSFGGMTLPRGVTINGEGQVLLADPVNNRILYFDNAGCGVDAGVETSHASIAPFRPLWQARELAQDSEPAREHALFTEPQLDVDFYDLLLPRDVLFLRDGTLAVADTGHHRVLIYAWPDLRLLRQIVIGVGVPWALAEDSRQRLYVADHAGGKVLRYSRFGELDSQFSGGVPHLKSPAALAFDREDNLLILDADHARLFLLEQDGEVEELSSLEVTAFLRDFAVPPLTLHDDVLEYPQLHKPGCEKLRLNAVAVDRQGHLQGTLLPLLARARSIRLPRSGVYISEQLDSGVLSSQWHRVVLEAQLPRTGRVLICTHASDRTLEDYEVADIEWSQPTLLSTDAPNHLPEMLVQSGAGRYLRLRLELLGDGYSTPAIGSIQVFGPRASSLRFLPPPFHQDPESAHFLDRFLSYFDTVQDEVRFLIRDFTRYLDPHSVPAGPFLDWLGSWFDWQFLANWPVELRRELISRSIEFFRQRGTLEGVRRILQWHTGLTGDQPQLIEHFRLRDYALLQERRSADVHQLFIAERPLTPAANQIAHWFTVVLPASVVPDAEALAQLQRLIEAQKPAHTAFQLRVFNPGVRIGRQSSIGLDTWLGNCPIAPLGTLSLGRTSTLAAPPAKGLKIGQRLSH